MEKLVPLYGMNRRVLLSSLAVLPMLALLTDSLALARTMRSPRGTMVSSSKRSLSS